MPPTSLLKILHRLLFFQRRNAVAEHPAKVVPDPLAEARAARINAEEKLERTEKQLIDTRGALWLAHQRSDRNSGNGNQRQ